MTGLTNGQAYQFTVHATNSVGDSDESSPATTAVTPLPPPSAPDAPTATATASAVTVTWDAVQAANVTGYTVTADPGPATCTTDVTDEDPTTCTLGAVAGTTYTYTVKALSAVGPSPDSPPSNAVEPPAPAVPVTVPDTPWTLTTDQGDITTAEPGEEIEVIGTGFAAHSTITITVYSDPVVLGTDVTDEDGEFTKSVTVPPNLTGSHSLVALGAGTDGTPRFLRLDIEIAAADAGATLPVTGPHVALLTMLAMLSIAAGTALVRLGRVRHGFPEERARVGRHRSRSPMTAGLDDEWEATNIIPAK